MANREHEFWELKESAKWSLDLSERVRAIQVLGALFGQEAISALNEVKNTTAYEEVRNMCIEVIKAAPKSGGIRNSPGAGRDQGKVPKTKKTITLRKAKRKRKRGSV